MQRFVKQVYCLLSFESFSGVQYSEDKNNAGILFSWYIMLSTVYMGKYDAHQKGCI